MARNLASTVGLFKVNIHLFTAAGPEAIRQLATLGPGIFLDLKYHDIPNTVAGAVSAAAALPGIQLLNLHTTGGEAMMRAAADELFKQFPGSASSSRAPQRPRLLGVTVLTSLDHAALRRIGLSGEPGSRAVSLARLAKRCGLDGVVASPQEVHEIRRACGRDFLIVTPGVRPTDSTGSKRGDDQARIATPGEAIRAGADYLVVGRPIYAAPDPRAAAEAIVGEISAALRAKHP